MRIVSLLLRNYCGSYFSVNCFALEIITNYLAIEKNAEIPESDQESKEKCVIDASAVEDGLQRKRREVSLY